MAGHRARKGKLRPGSATKIADAEYQRLCELTVRVMRTAEQWEPLSGDGIEVEVKIGTGKVTLDIALRSPDGARILIGECRGWKNNLPKEHIFALHDKITGLAQATGASVEGMLFAHKGFQRGLVELAEGYCIRLAQVRKGQNQSAFTIAFAVLGHASGKVVLVEKGAGLGERMTMKGGGRLELKSPDKQVLEARDF